MTDLATCCLNDCTNNLPVQSPQLCPVFSPLTKCDVTSSVCQDNLLGYCTGSLPTDDPNSPDWLNRWRPNNVRSNTNNNNCSYAVATNLFTNPGVFNLFAGTQPPSSAFQQNSGYIWSRELMTAVFDKYKQQGYVIGTNPGQQGYNAFQDTILAPICNSVPGICESSISSVCNNVTVNDINRNPKLLPWCGCYMNNIQYQQYVDLYGIRKECVPTCSRSDVILLAAPDGKSVLRCNQNVCLIDNTTINLQNTGVGAINFTQVCGGCDSSMGATASCQCIISDSNITAADSQLGNINLSQNCSTKSQCYKNNPNPGNGLPERLPIDCNGPTNQDPYAALLAQQTKGGGDNSWRPLLIILVVVILIIILAIFILNINKGKSEK